MPPKKTTPAARTSGVSAKPSPGRRSKPVAPARAKAVSTATRADLLFAVPRVTKLMRRDRLAGTVGRSSGLVMAAVMEYLTSEVLELAGNLCQEGRRHRIKPRDLMLAIANDEELSKVVSGAIFHESGVAPHVEPALLPQKKGAKGSPSKRQSSGGTQEV